MTVTITDFIKPTNGIVRKLEGWLSELPRKLNLSRSDSDILLAKVADIREFLESRI